VVLAVVAAAAAAAAAFVAIEATAATAAAAAAAQRAASSGQGAAAAAAGKAREAGRPSIKSKRHRFFYLLRFAVGAVARYPDRRKQGRTQTPVRQYSYWHHQPVPARKTQ
jgi:hypothetical protein